MSDEIAEIGGWSLRLQRDGRWLMRGPWHEVGCDGETSQACSMITAADLCELWGRLVWFLPDDLLVPLRAAVREAVTLHGEAVRRQRQHSAKIRRAVAARRLADALNVATLEADAEGGAL